MAITASLEPRISTIIRAMGSVMGGAGSDIILDGASIGMSIAAVPEVQSAVLVNTGPAALDGRIVINKIDDFLSVTGKTPFIKYSENRINGQSTGRILISLDLETAPDFLTLLSEEAVNYLVALMAPAALGEPLTKSEYLFLVSTVYGQAAANEIRDAKINAVIQLPGPVKTVTGGSANSVANGARANFEIPLIDILVLETPQSWEITW